MNPPQYVYLEDSLEGGKQEPVGGEQLGTVCVCVCVYLGFNANSEAERGERREQWNTQAWRNAGVHSGGGSYLCGCPGVAENQHVLSTSNQSMRWSPQRSNSHTQNQTFQNQGPGSMGLPNSDS